MKRGILKVLPPSNPDAIYFTDAYKDSAWAEWEIKEMPITKEEFYHKITNIESYENIPLLKELFNIDNFDQDYLETKNWGFKYSCIKSSFLCVDICFIVKGGYCSWHYHEQKDNIFIVLFGKLEVEREWAPDDAKRVKVTLDAAGKNRKTYVKINHKHKFTALTDCILLEIENTKCHSQDIFRDDEGGIL